ncbi:MAG: DUF3179 domain-containing (seleno)protein [Gemmatimonadota bacterium]|nr:DUF3179 domain-containing (seleno)protein [Gemmatimonadota bacterium]
MRCRRLSTTAAVRASAVALCAIVASACSDSATTAPAMCAIPLEDFYDAGPARSEIPALTNPVLATRGTPDIAYLTLGDLVIGFTFNGQPAAIPHKFLWHHEVVNMEIPGEAITVSYSPLTGASVVYDRTPSELGALDVSNYVLNSGLVMTDPDGSLRPQMSPVASCGPNDGSSLPQISFEVMTLGAWFGQNPSTWVASSANDPDILYTLFPYGSNYQNPDNSQLVYPIEGGVDPRRPPKERVLGVRSGTGGIAFPYTLLDQLRGAPNVFVSAANATLDGEAIVVFWNALAQGAHAYRAEVDGQRLHFELVEGQRRDVETGSTWNFAGQAVDGPLDGAELEPITDVISSYWFAWAAYQPDTDVFDPPVAASLLPLSQLVIPTEGVDWELATR